MLQLSEATKRHLRRCYLSPEDKVEVEVDNADESKLRIRLSSDWGDGFTRAPSYHSETFIRFLPEKKRIGGHRSYTWEVPATTATRDILSEMENRFNGQVAIQEYARKVLDIVALECQVREKNATAVGRWRAHKKFPIGTKYLPDHPEHPLMSHQKMGRHCILNSDAACLFMEQGTGKTPIMINAMCILAMRKRRKDPNSVFRVLVVAPKNVRYNWQEEIEFFGICDHRTTVIRGGAFQREKDLLFGLLPDKEKTPLSVTVVSYGSMVQSIDAFSLKSIAGKRLKNHIKWDMVILDESHYVKTPSAKRTKATFSLRDCSDRRYILTGTPITNTLLDLWSQFEFLGKGMSGFTTFQAFREFYGVYKLDEMGHKKLVEFENIPLLQELLARNAFVVTKKEALPNLPDKVYDAIEVQMTKEQTQKYVDVATQILVEAEAEMDDNSMPQEMKVHSILTKMLRLSQVTSGFVKYDDTFDDDGELIEVGRTDRFDPNPKLETLVEILKDKTPEQKTIVWALYKQDIKTIAARLRLEGIKCVTYYGETNDKDREKAKNDFNKDPETKVLIGSAGAGGTGLNLLGFDPKDPDKYDTYCDHVIYFSQNWSQPLRSQSEDRVHRKGVKCNVRITDLVVPGTIDEEIRKRVRLKKKVADEIQDVKGILLKLAGPAPVSNGDG